MQDAETIRLGAEAAARMSAARTAAATRQPK
jgi:hypothetical protein